jgi:hypothetical protein
MNRNILASLVVVGIAAAVSFNEFYYWGTKKSQYSNVIVSEEMPDGRVDISLQQVGEMTVVIAVKLAMDQETIDLFRIKPEATLAMEEMHMDGISPMFSEVGSGFWQGKVILPMAGLWVVSAGFGEEFIETTIDVQ